MQRELSDALLRTAGVKISNHQGCFAYVCVKFPELELDWKFFEKMRTTRNRNKYEGSNISKQDWKAIEIQMRLYVSTLEKSIGQRFTP